MKKSTEKIEEKSFEGNPVPKTPEEYQIGIDRLLARQSELESKNEELLHDNELLRDRLQKAFHTNEMRTERWHFALEASGDGVWDWNLITNELFLSDQWKDMLGYSGSEIENKYSEWEKLVHPDDLGTCIHELDKHLNGESEVYMSEYRMRRKDGNYTWILDRGKLIERTPDGKPLRIVGTHEDITSRKHYEEQLRKSIEKEKELNELKSRFVAATSHEFRTPLASVVMITDTLISYHQKMNINQMLARLGKIKNHVLHLTEIVNNVLQLSKMQEGKIGFNPQNVDMVPMCLNIIDGFNAGKLPKDQISFSSPFKALTVRVDDLLITQAINNLLSNAIKYSGDDFFVHVELKLENDELVLGVQDKGIGIPEEDVKLLFTPFFRAGNASMIQGNGLGLCIARESLLLHGGRISCSNNADKGSTFKLHFPVNLISAYTLSQSD